MWNLAPEMLLRVTAAGTVLPHNDSPGFEHWCFWLDLKIDGHEAANNRSFSPEMT